MTDLSREDVAQRLAEVRRNGIAVAHWVSDGCKGQPAVVGLHLGSDVGWLIQTVETLDQATDQLVTKLEQWRTTVYAAAMCSDCMDGRCHDNRDKRPDRVGAPCGCQRHDTSVALAPLFAPPPAPAAGEDVTLVAPELRRWCEWPGCGRWYDATAGPTIMGWRRYFGLIVMCPPHAQAGHEPGRFVDGDSLTARCGCGSAEPMTERTNAAVLRWWHSHITTTMKDMPS